MISFAVKVTIKAKRPNSKIAVTNAPTFVLEKWFGHVRGEA